MRTLLNNLDLSTEPTFTGKYRAGKKVYQKIINGICNSTSFDIAINETYTLAWIDPGMSYVYNGNTFPICMPWNSAGVCITAWVTPNGTVHVFNTSWTGSNVIASVAVLFTLD